MPFDFFVSNKLDLLAEALAEELARQTNADPLEPDWVVVPNAAMDVYLRQRLASHNDICANLRVLKISELFRIGCPSLESLRPDSLKWRFFREIVCGEIPLPKPVANYLDGAEREFKSYQFATRMIHVFDQYNTYRYDSLDRLLKEDSFQRELFDRFFGHACGVRDRVLSNRFFAPAKVPPVIHVFGFGSLPKLYIDFLHRLAAEPLRSVRFYYLSPCMEYFACEGFDKNNLRKFDARRCNGPISNPLLSAWGGQGRDLLNLTLDAQDISYQSDRFVPGDCASMLSRFQNSILTLSDPAEFPGTRDDSIQIHSCHSEQREVEVLYNLLLHEMHGNGVPARDIMVLAPDINGYVPYIESVFGREGNPLEHLYSITGRDLLSENRLASSLLELFALADSRMEQSRILALLENPAIAHKFALSDEDVDILIDCFQRSAVRWGQDAREHARVTSVPFGEFSWENGIDNLLFGFASDLSAQERSERCVRGGFPPGIHAVNGGNYLSLDRFLQFYETLLRARETLLAHAHTTLSSMIRLTLSLLDDFFESDRAASHDFSAVHAALDKIASDSDCFNGGDLPVTRALFAQILRETLSQSAESGFLRGKISFSSFTPQRGIPHKVIAVLGMNEGAFPRMDNTCDFNLLGLSRLPGDRIRTEEDRYAFLEVFMAAEQRLFYLYRGRDARSDTVNYPAIPLAELLDVLHATYPGESFVVQHPLQEFSPDYFRADAPAPIFSFSKENYEAAQALLTPTNVPPAPKHLQWDLSAEDFAPVEELSLNDLSDFFKNPCKAFLRKTCALYFPRETPYNDREMIVPDPLETYSLRTHLWSYFCEEDDFDLVPLARFLQQTGELPPGEAGLQTLRAISLEMKPLPKMSSDDQALFRAAPRRVSFRHGAIALSGELFLSDDGLRQVVFSSGKGREYKGFISGYLRHLFAVCLQTESRADSVTTTFYTSGHVHPLQWRETPLAEAQKQLDALLSLYELGRKRPLPVFANTMDLLLKCDEPAQVPWQEILFALRASSSGDDDAFGRGDFQDRSIAHCFDPDSLCEDGLRAEMWEYSRIFRPCIPDKLPKKSSARSKK